MEELLNKLIDKGRVPFGDEKIHSFEIIYVTGKIWNIVAKRGRGQVNKHYSIIELCSKSSLLWQFVCEMSINNYNKEKGKVLTWKKFEDDKYQINGYSNGGGYIQDYEYRLIETALTDEDKLEQFLLDNIKVE